MLVVCKDFLINAEAFKRCKVNNSSKDSLKELALIH